MIDGMSIRNFKSLLNIDITFSNINLLAGINGLGKSSLIQVLLLIRQSYQKNLFPSEGILLNGNLISLGKGKDVLNILTEQKEIYWKLELHNFPPIEIFLDYNPDSDFLQIIKAKSKFDSGSLKHQLFNNFFKYLNAERISPRFAYQASLFEALQNESLGIHGEYTPLFLALKKREPVKLKDVLHPKASSEILLDQVSAWLNEISPGFNIDSNYLPDIDYANVVYKFQGESDLSYDFSPPNVGFGLTYVLPILTLILSAKPGDILVIENPESHIHPQGQTKLGELIFLAGQAGVQLFIETHSDHVLNGIRVAVHNNKKNAELVKMLFFKKPANGDKHYVEIASPKLDNNGRIDEWPDGFFDEWEKTLMELV